MAADPDWIELQLRRRGISDPRVLAAMATVPRECFAPPALKGHAYDDTALPLPCGQSVSQPFVVAYMAQALALQGDEHVLDVGTGSGYAAAVLAELCASVESIERIPALAQAAIGSLAVAGVQRVSVHVGDGTLGLPESAPFGGIAVAAAAESVPEALRDQLLERGRLVIPLVRHRSERLCVFERRHGSLWLLETLPARFVPLVSYKPC
jgi:protein-L-isoaspartate(D-aspartate) O-methyltransferase